MNKIIIGNATLFHGDCNSGMADMPDKAYSLAIVDPPYGMKRSYRPRETKNRFCENAKINKWDTKPYKEYFIELFRISQF